MSGQRAAGKENSGVSRFAVSGAMVMGLVLLTQGASWWRARRSAKLDSRKKDSGRTRGLVSPFDLLLVLLFGGGLLVSCSLIGSPVVE